MNKIIEQVMSQVGVNQEQAEGGLGAILSFAKEQLNNDTFSSITSNIEGSEGLINKFSNLSSSEGGLDVGGLLGSATSALGINADVGGIASIVGNLSSLNLDLDTLKKFAPVVSNYLNENGHSDIAEKINSLL